jgi:hypothetical protein
MIKLLRPDEVWQPKLGAPVGNRNGRRVGPHDAETRALRRRIVRVRRTARALILRLQKQRKDAKKAHQ